MKASFLKEQGGLKEERLELVDSEVMHRWKKKGVRRVDKHTKPRYTEFAFY